MEHRRKGRYFLDAVRFWEPARPDICVGTCAAWAEFRPLLLTPRVYKASGRNSAHHGEHPAARRTRTGCRDDRCLLGGTSARSTPMDGVSLFKRSVHDQCREKGPNRPTTSTRRTDIA